MLVTKTGLVFIAGGDNKVRAYDEDTGQVVWTGSIPGASSGIPTGYEMNGRQYVVFSSQPRIPAGRGGRGRPPIAEAPPDVPRGYIAFALPAREKPSPGNKY
jgi:quinoprotein glucose dehydrogenase